ncbi:diacylglycerol kinase family protein [Streptomyces sp. GC420]|uniref:diacylglycerol/lipid kinase family protein n=1 Tax=Streptomyces sp. GC420 TaxID=2697568 RepID=UPI0014150463|nr:diacylglycerol kinase family protein [Streptomyces sp. GC420]NBM16014.1 diacylglycerol kinase [Streptomyces sp. GC420]
MVLESGDRAHAAQRWSARLSLTAAVLAVLLPLLWAGADSLILVAVLLFGVTATVAALWWVLAHRGLTRAAAGVLAVLVPLTVVAFFDAEDMLLLVVLSLGLWAVSVWAGRAALTSTGSHTVPVTEHRTPAPRRPFLIMNPRSGDGKVVRFGLKEKAEALGAQVVLLDPDRPVDVAALAREAADAGADLLGVAGGDGTQALVAGVAAERGLPFLVISAGTRNHFAMDLGLDRENPAASLDALTDGVEVHVDLGFAAGRPFVNNASFGAYAAVVQSPAYRGEKVRTILELLPDLLTRQRGPRLTVHAAGTTIEAPQAVLVSNNPYRTGDPAGLGLRERLDSGALGVLGVTVDNAAQAAGLLRGRQAAGLTVLTAREVVVDADLPRIEVGIDGEALVLPVPVHCRIEPGALRVRVPGNRPGVPAVKPPMDWRRLRKLAATVGRTAVARHRH